MCHRITGQDLQVLPGNYRSVRSLLFSPDSQTLASIGDDDGNIATIKIWNANTGQLQHSFTTDNLIPPYRSAFSPDGKIFASGHGTTIQVWNLTTGKLLHKLEDNNDADISNILALAISPDSQIIATGHLGGGIKIWNLRTGKLLRTLAGHSTPVNKLTFSPFGQILVSGGSSYTDIYVNGFPQSNVEDASLKMWNWQTGELVRTLIDNYESITALAIEPYGQILASGSQNEIKIWNLHTGQLLRTMDVDDVGSLTFSADGQTLFVDNFNYNTHVYETQVWQLATP
ncbi:MAG: WD40 repeat domain-containing protein [Coleofasciculus sp. B1-GNL1-01]|uniref:WD40 repeat domain-containing protein n=1 Tax=Coleofasciculus sp. B1-GNL1-01 TaxID=3068484 RepID=UPI0032F77862